MTTASEKYRIACETRDQAIKDAKKAAKEAFAEQCQELFAKHPLFCGFGWVQYTPYFNDGDTCHFGAHYDDVLNILSVEKLPIDEEPDVEDDEDGYLYYNLWIGDDSDISKKVEKFTDDAATLVGKFDSDLEDMFGDHAMVTVRRDRVDVDEYNHD